MPESTSRYARYLEAILLALGFAMAYTQSPLYYSNQNQYLLHGLAAGGLGHLDRDWLANTRDPTPLFSAMTSFGYRYLGEWSFQAAYFLLLIIYFLGARCLVAALPGMPHTRAFRLAFAGLFTAAHAAVVRMASVELVGVDYPWYLQSGVANQYLLGTGLQPSAFGVLLLVALAAFANSRPVLAGATVGLACAFHSTYLLPAAMLFPGFLVMTVMKREKGGQAAFKAVLAASLFAAPSTVYALFTFGTSNHSTFAESQRILAEIRIPHHCEIDRWFAVPDALQLAWVVVGLLLLRRSILFGVLVPAAAIGLALSLVQYLTENHTLALLFPWRIAALLVPVATAVILANVAAQLPSSRTTELAAVAVVILLSAGGIWVMAAQRGYRMNEAEFQLLEYVRNHAGPEDMYLLPVRIPEVGAGRGTASTTFTPPPRPKSGSNLIPVDLQRFRLHTGTPIYVDFKSVPYYHLEVIEWLRRMRQCEAWYEGDWRSPGQLQDLRAGGITHIVAPAAKPLPTDYLEVVHSDPAYIVYRLR